jgi:hypothetical protein
MATAPAGIASDKRQRSEHDESMERKTPTLDAGIAFGTDRGGVLPGPATVDTAFRRDG